MTEENKLLIGIFFPVRPICLEHLTEKYLNIVLIGDSFSPFLQIVSLFVNKCFKQRLQRRGRGSEIMNLFRFPHSTYRHPPPLYTHLRIPLVLGALKWDEDWPSLQLCQVVALRGDGDVSNA